MKFAKITVVGKYLPKKVLTNRDLEKMVNTSDEWITARTGIKERRIADKNEATSDLALKAGVDALKNARIKAQDLDLIIVATITPDTQFPSTASIIQSRLGAKKAACFDISAACSGFVYSLIIAQQFIESGLFKNVLIIGAEKLSMVIDWTDRNTCVLFGDGAGAAVVSRCEKPGILSTYMGGDGSLGNLLMVPAGGSRIPTSHETIDQKLHYLRMQGNEIFKLAVKAMTDAAKKALLKAKLNISDIDCLITHQANARIILATGKRLGLSQDKIFMNINKYGNTSSASIAIALCEAIESKRIKKGGIVVLDAFGAGLAWGACVIKW